MRDRRDSFSIIAQLLAKRAAVASGGVAAWPEPVEGSAGVVVGLPRLRPIDPASDP